MRWSLIASVALLLPLAVLAASPKTVVLEVQNMTCSVCPITVRKSLQKVPGVVEAKVDFEKQTAIVTFDPDKASPAVLVKATTDAGFPSSARN